MKHPECEHCQHEDPPIRKTAKLETSEEIVLDLLRAYKTKGLTRNQIRSGCGLSPHEIMNALRELVQQNRVAYSGANIEARNAKFKLFGAMLWT